MKGMFGVKQVEEMFGVKQVEAAIFIVFAVVYTVLQLWWAIAVARNPGGFLPAFADQSPTAINNNAMLLFVLVTSLLYAGIGIWLGIKDSAQDISSFLTRENIAGFLMRAGVALMVFSSVGQIASVFVPAAKWTLPAEGIPVMRTLTIAVSLGIFLAGVGGNMTWGQGRREEFLAATGGKKKK